MELLDQKYSTLRIYTVYYNICVGIADQSVHYDRNEEPDARGCEKVVEYNSGGDIFHMKFNEIQENISFDQSGDIIFMELNMDSDPRTLAFFVNNKQLSNYITNIPSSVRFWAHVYVKEAQFKVTKFKQIYSSIAKHNMESSKAFEWGQDWTK
ncbi:MAG: hypothetical protein EZS28_032195 [Streblomastix strix]|uniref:SPRY domain-containing protein n=1 Tax=Streblomastix strix TaxID=222440 RepID=A0A5J4UP82_9EUKA|nr:MAG: hypothetical protein EZS28_032195 [Streblomastix strix]